LSLPDARLGKLKEQEDEELRALAAEAEKIELDVETSGRGPLEELEARLFAPVTTGVFFPSRRRRDPADPGRLRETYFSALIASDASGRDLARLGVKVRSRACDVFTAFVPRSAVRRLEASSFVRAVELARPWFYDLNVAIPFTGMNALHGAAPPVTGAGVVVGVIDNPMDFYHPDFRTAAGATRLQFLWDQSLVPQAGEAGPPIAPALPGFTPAGGVTYGVEYNQATINAELAAFNPPAVPAYQTVRHTPPAPPINGANGHGTFVTSCAAGNGLAQAGTFVGAAPGATIIFVRPLGVAGTALAADSTATLDGFAYIFARAAQLGLPCVVNLSASDNQGPHDGATLGEQFLDALLLTPGRCITLSAGNSNGTASHATGNVAGGATTNLVLAYLAGATRSDAVEIWYAAVGGVSVQITSVLNDPRNGDNLISIVVTVPVGQQIPSGNWTIALTGTTVINGSFHAWVDRNNRGLSSFQAPLLQENTLTLGVPSTARRPITVGAHDTTAPTPAIAGFSGRGPTRDGRIKPEVASVGASVTAASPRNMNSPLAGQPLYQAVGGTSFSAPLVAGACALLFECRGAALTAADLKQVLEDQAGTTGIAVPSNAFGFGFVQMAAACATPATSVDVWLKDDAADIGNQPSGAAVFWASPDIAILDTAGNPVPNPTYSAVNRFNNIIRVTIRNRGAQVARNTNVFLYWADPSTNIPFPAAWNSSGIYTGAPGFVNQGNLIVVPQIAAGGSTTIDFAWAPPAPGSSLAGDSHFCLLVRLEHEADPSNIGAGGFPVVAASNNIGLHNVTVQP
jgi:hypothetical protein